VLGLLASFKGDIMNWLSMVAMLPFLMLVKGEGKGEEKIQVNYKKLMELAVIALVTAGLSSYVMVQVMDVKIDFIHEDIAELKKVIDKVDDKVDKIIWERVVK